MFWYGLLVDWNLLGSIILIMLASARCARRAMVYAERAEISTIPEDMESLLKRARTDLFFPPSSALPWLSLFAVFVFYMMSVLLPIFLFLIGTIMMAIVHCLARPVTNEYYYIQQTVAAKKAQERQKQYADCHQEDDGNNEDGEVTFTQVDISDDKTTSLRNRRGMMGTQEQDG